MAIMLVVYACVLLPDVVCVECKCVANLQGRERSIRGLVPRWEIGKNS